MIFRNTVIGKKILRFSNSHVQGEKKNIFIFSTPRSGSTWTKEIFSSERGMKFINEPFNLRNTQVSRYLKTSDWCDTYSKASASKLLNYLTSIEKGEPASSFLNTFPMKDNYRYKTNRIVFKILHGLEDRIEEIRTELDAHVVFLIRHPIAVSLSRKECPRLQALISSDYSRHFNQEQLNYAQNIADNGSKLEKLVVSWCMQNYVPLKMMNDNWVVLTYEQLTLDSDSLLSYVCKKLDLDCTSDMYEKLTKASRSTNLSDEKTQKILNSVDGNERKQYLVRKWSQKVTDSEEKHLMDILKVFDIDLYKKGSYLPDSRYLIPSSSTLTE